MENDDLSEVLSEVSLDSWLINRRLIRRVLFDWTQLLTWGKVLGDKTIKVRIDKTRNFFESLGIKTRFSEYDIPGEKADELVKALEKHGHTSIGENGEVNLEVSRKILEAAV